MPDFDYDKDYVDPGHDPASCETPLLKKSSTSMLECHQDRDQDSLLSTQYRDIHSPLTDTLFVSRIDSSRQIHLGNLKLLSRQANYFKNVLYVLKFGKPSWLQYF